MFVKKKCKTTASVKKNNPDQLKPPPKPEGFQPRVPPLPKEKPLMNLVTSKNFIVANAVEAILAAPKKVLLKPIIN
jgi:hypothetical protein